MTAPPAPSAPAATPVAVLRARGRVRGGLPLLGPAFVAAIAYVDPGNFATNFSGGARYGYLLLWVIVAANAMAMLVQSLSAKAGLATGLNLAELCRAHFSRRVSRGLWVQAELVAMATDLAEVVGGAIALQLLFGLPLLVGGVITGAVAFGLLALQQRGYRRFELVVGGMFAVILLGFLVDLLRVDIDPGAAAAGLVPRFEGPDSVLLATGILGATVMPHAVYLHSALTQGRVPAADGESAGTCCGTSASTCSSRWASRASPTSRCSWSRPPSPGREAWPRPATTCPASTPRSARCSGRAPRTRSPSPCWPPGSRAPGSAPCPVRWSCRASSGGGCRWGCAGW